MLLVQHVYNGSLYLALPPIHNRPNREIYHGKPTTTLSQCGWMVLSLKMATVHCRALHRPAQHPITVVVVIAGNNNKQIYKKMPFIIESSEVVFIR